MKKAICFITFVLISLTGIAQNDDELKPIPEDTLKSDVVFGKVERISKNPRIQNKMLNFKKSNDIISIKSYMRSLQIKGKVTKLS